MGFLAVMGSILLVRLFLLTVVEHDRWDDYADDVSSRAVYETAPRGDILDRNGKSWQTSKAVYSINLSRVNLSEEDALAASAEVFKVLKANDEDIETTQEEVSKTLEKKDYQGISSCHTFSSGVPRKCDGDHGKTAPGNSGRCQLHQRVSVRFSGVPCTGISGTDLRERDEVLYEGGWISQGFQDREIGNRTSI